jgi:hypothetical protein
MPKITELMSASITVHYYKYFYISLVLDYFCSGFGGLGVSMLASGTQDRGFKLGRSRWIFSWRKKSRACLPLEGK